MCDFMFSQCCYEDMFDACQLVITNITVLFVINGYVFFNKFSVTFLTISKI